MKIKLNSKGAKTLVIDCGVLGEPSFQPNITREEVAKAAGEEFERLRSLRDDAEAIRVRLAL